MAKVFLLIVCGFLSECQGLRINHANPFPERAASIPTLKEFYYLDTFAVQNGYRVKLYGDSYANNVRKCLAGKKVLILGNSVSRHWVYALRDILVTGTVGNRSRIEEMQECGRGGIYGGERPGQGSCYGLCGCSFETDDKTTLGFLWQQRIYDPEESTVLQHECPDLLTINAGGDDIFDQSRRPAFKETLETEVPQLRNMLTEVIASCPETKLYWRTTTPLCNGSPEEENEMIKYSNQKITAMLAEAELASVYIYDSWAKNVDRCKDYDDHVHHSKLVDEHLHDVLSDYCGI